MLKTLLRELYKLLVNSWVSFFPGVWEERQAGTNFLSRESLEFCFRPTELLINRFEQFEDLVQSSRSTMIFDLLTKFAQAGCAQVAATSFQRVSRIPERTWRLGSRVLLASSECPRVQTPGRQILAPESDFQAPNDERCKVRGRQG